MSSVKRATLHLDANTIVGDYKKIAQHSANMISFITNSTADLVFEEIPCLPVFFKFSMGEIKYDNDKKHFLEHWIFEKGLVDVVKGVIMCLARANYLLELKKLKGKVMTKAEYDALHTEINTTTLKKHLPELIEDLNEGLKEPLSYIEEITSINKVRNCLEHRNSFVTKKDCNTQEKGEDVLQMRWISPSIEVTRGSEVMLVKEEGFTVKKGDIISVKNTRIMSSYKIGELVKINLDTFQQLVYTGYLFANDLTKKINLSAD